ANPKHGRFDTFDPIVEQLDLPPTLINRFDLIFPIKDLPDPVKDDKMASFILELHQDTRRKEAPIPTTLLKKYVAYARLNIHPVLSDEAVAELKDYYIRMRGSARKEGGIIQNIPISARQLEGLVRLSEAHARLRLGEVVERQDARNAINLLDYCLRQIALDEETGTIDIDRISSDTTTSQRNKIVVFKEVMAELENKFGKVVPLDDIARMAAEKGVSQDELDVIIQKLRKSGDIFEPRRNYISRV
ncbi:minichromosome maintenance protein MCM, partial [Candidatus Magnetobacterium casensis]